jgi:hypothetical protein
LVRKPAIRGNVRRSTRVESPTPQVGHNMAHLINGVASQAFENEKQ